MKKDGQESAGKRVYTSLLLLLLAIVSITAATAAWFTIADNTKVQSMSLDIFSGISLRFDTVPHEKLEEYKKTLTFEEICEFVVKEQGVDWRKSPLEPVTTQDCTAFTLENGRKVESNTGKYLEFTLHFMAAEDMVVHLTSENSEGNEDGTRIVSETPGLASAMRISFADGKNTKVYDPGGAGSQALAGMRIFGLPSADKMVYNEENSLFSLKANEDLPVLVHIWLEGTDEACTDDLRGASYSIHLRFEGTDQDNNRMSGRPVK